MVQAAQKCPWLNNSIKCFVKLYMVLDKYCFQNSYSKCICTVHTECFFPINLKDQLPLAHWSTLYSVIFCYWPILEMT